MSLGVAPAFAQAGALTGGSLSPVNVTASRNPMRVDQTVAGVIVVEREEIERAAGRTLTDLLTQKPGLQSSSNGGMGKVANLSFRGLEARHTLLLIDGVRYGSASVGTPVFENLSLDQIDRVEIVPGPLSSLYGSDAVGGVIQIFTRRGRPGFQANAALSLGSRRYNRESAGFGWANGPWDAAVQIAHVTTRGFSATNSRSAFGFNADDDGFRQNSGTAQVGLKLAGDWRLGAKLVESSGITDIDDGPGVNARAKLRTELVAVDLAGSWLRGWRSVTRLSQSVDESTSLSSASPFNDLGAFKTKQAQVTHEESLVTPVGTVMLLADYLHQTVSKPADPYAVTERRVAGFAGGLNGQSGPHSWQASLRHDHSSQFGSEDTGALGYAFDVTSALRIGAAAGTSFVMPSFNQLYYPVYGSPDLQPEHGKSLELNARYVEGAHQLRLALFDQRVRNFISGGPQPVNVPRSRVKGMTLSYEGRLFGWATTASIDSLNPRTTSGPNAGRVLVSRSKTAFKAGIDRDIGAFNVGVAARAFGGRYDDVANTRRVGGFAAGDLHADWRFKPNWTLSGQLNNLAGRQYETISGYNQPGREFYLTLRYSQ